MLPRVLTKNQFKGFAQELLRHYRVAGPVETEPGRFAFRDVADVSELRLDYPTTMLPPKKYLTPQLESLLEFKRGTVESKPTLDRTPQVLLGVHPCDLHGIFLLDTVFADKIEDPHYLQRRKNTLVIGVECLQPCDEYQFCLDMGTLYPKEGYDLLLTQIGENYHVEFGTPAGQQLVEQYAPKARRPEDDDMEAYRTAMDVKQGNFRHKLPFDVKHLPEVLDEAYDSLVWQALGRRSVSCGSCNLVCPTCYCFNVTDKLDLNLSDGRRSRSWDSCQLQEFATVAGGENFRKDRGNRLRHRFFRKGKFIQEMFGKVGCTGCGRCSRHCPADINIIDVYCQIAGRTRR